MIEFEFSVQYTHLHAGPITLMCVCKPEVSTGTLIHIESLDVDVDMDNTPTPPKQKYSNDGRLERSNAINQIVHPKMDILLCRSKPDDILSSIKYKRITFLSIKYEIVPFHCMDKKQLKHSWKYLLLYFTESNQGE